MATHETQDDELRAEAPERLRKRSEFWTHLAFYVLVNAFWYFVAGAGFFWPMFRSSSGASGCSSTAGTRSGSRRSLCVDLA